MLGACEGTEGEKGDKGDKGDTGPQGDGQGAAILGHFKSAANFIGYVTGSDLEDEQVLQTVTADGYILRLESYGDYYEAPKSPSTFNSSTFSAPLIRTN